MKRTLWIVALVALLGGAARADGIAEARTARVRAVDAVPRGPGVEERLAEIRRRIQSALVYPPAARWQKLEGETLVRFGIASNGDPEDVQIQRSSGARLLDRAASHAVADAAPLPWVYGRLEVPVRFDFESRR